LSRGSRGRIFLENPIQDAVNELTRMTISVTSGNFNRFVDRDWTRQTTMDHLVRGHAKDISIDGCHSLNGPVRRMFPDPFVEFAAMLTNSSPQLRRKLDQRSVLQETTRDKLLSIRFLSQRVQILFE
jgi:hypothetical protein